MLKMSPFSRVLEFPLFVFLSRSVPGRAFVLRIVWVAVPPRLEKVSADKVNNPYREYMTSEDQIRTKTVTT